MLSNNHPPSSNCVLNQDRDRFTCRQILPRIATETLRQVPRRTPAPCTVGQLLVGGHRWCLHPPLGGPRSLQWVWREEISTQPWPCNTSQVFSLSVPFIKNSKPGFDDSLRLVIAPAIKAQQNTGNPGVHPISQLHRNQEKLKLNLGKSRPAPFSPGCMQQHAPLPPARGAWLWWGPGSPRMA